VIQQKHEGLLCRVAPSVTALVLAGLSALACSDTASTTTFTPQTGIVVRSETLTSGIGCGTGDTQIFKYVAVAIDAASNAEAAGTFDCFADGVLVNLLPATAADGTVTLDYTVRIYAFNQAAYTAGQAKQPSITTLVSAPNVSGSSVFAAASFATLGATYTTTCTATEQSGIQVVAVCERLAASK